MKCYGLRVFRKTIQHHLSSWHYEKVAWPRNFNRDHWASRKIVADTTTWLMISSHLYTSIHVCLSKGSAIDTLRTDCTVERSLGCRVTSRWPPKYGTVLLQPVKWCQIFSYWSKALFACIMAQCFLTQDNYFTMQETSANPLHPMVAYAISIASISDHRM